MRANASRERSSPSGIVAHASGARAISASTKARSVAFAIGTSISTMRQFEYGLAGSSTARVAVERNRDRSTADAARNCPSNRSSSAARSPPPSPAPRMAAAGTIASDTSSSVRASARGKPGASATGAKYESAPARETSNSARAATARTPSGVVGDNRSRASSGAARRAASWVRLNRYIPNVAPRLTASVRARSSAAARDAATMRHPVSGEASKMNRRAASRRTMADEERTIRTAALPPDAVPGILETTAPRCRERIIAEVHLHLRHRRD